MSTLYRKYRPKKFADLVAQEHISDILLAQIRASSYSHSYLFTGPRGCGKTSTARILAKAICCENPENGEPCGKCNACLQIDTEKALDIVEIDAASNRTIDDIRDLKEKITFPPINLKKKIFIIDEIHMLTKEAFNALLKTLEEPPEYAIFILATTDIHKVPATILSRCQRFDFRLATVDELKQKLFSIAKEENLKLTDEIAELVANMGQGSFRDSESVLEKLITSLQLGDRDIDQQQAYEILGLSDMVEVREIYGLIYDYKFEEAIKILNRVRSAGKSINQFLEQILIYSRDAVSDQKFTERGISILEEFAAIFTELKYHKYPEIVLELAIYRLCIINNNQSDNNILVSDGNDSHKPDNLKIDTTITTVVTSKQNSHAEITSEITDEMVNESDEKFTIDDLKRDWISFIKTIELQNPNLASLIANSIPLKLHTNNVTLRAKFKIHKDIIDKKNSQTTLTTIASQVFGLPLTFVCVFERIDNQAKITDEKESVIKEDSPKNIEESKAEKKINHSEVFADMIE